MDKLKYWIILLLAVASQSLYALTTCTVTLSTDADPGGPGNAGDLRNCLNTMNQSLNSLPDDYAIVFATPMTIQLNGTLPIINNSPNPVNITIGNTGSAATVTLDGGNTYSGFFIPTGNVIIQNMIFQNMAAKGGNGGNGNAAGGGGMGAGGAIYAPQTFLNGSNPSVTLMNVSINNCVATGGNGGSYSISSGSGFEGGAGGGGFGGNGGSIVTSGDSTGGAGGGGFGGNGGDVTLTFGDPSGGGGGGGGGWGSRATLGTPINLGNGGSDQSVGSGGNGLGLTITAGAGGGGNSGGNNVGGGGGGAGSQSGGGGGGSAGSDGLQPQGSIPPLRAATRGWIHKPTGKSVSEVLRELSERAAKAKGRKIKSNVALVHQRVIAPGKVHGGSAVPSGGNGEDGGGGGGGGVVTTSFSNGVDGQSGSGGYGGGGGGGAGTGASDINFTVLGGSGGLGGGGGGGGVNQSGSTDATGGNSLGGGGGGGGGPSNGTTASGGTDVGSLGGGSGGTGANNVGSGFGGGGGGGGSGLGGAIFVDSNLNFTIQALSGIPTTFNTSNNTTVAGTHGTGGPGGSDGTDGSALGNSIFLRTNSSLTLLAQDAGNVLTLGSQVSFADDTSFGVGGTVVFVSGNGTIIYNGTTDYQGNITINNANFKVNGLIDGASMFVCRNNTSSQRGTLSGSGTMTGNVFANSGAISPDNGQTLSLGSLNLSPAGGSSLGSLVHININSGGTSLVAVTGAASLAGILEINLDPSAAPGHYTLLTSSGITGTFDSVTFAGGTTPNYTLSYLPAGAPTHVDLDFEGFPSPPVTSVDIPATVNGSPVINPAVVCCGRPVILGPLPVPGSGPTVYTVTAHTGSVTCKIGTTPTQTYLRMEGKSGSCTIVGTKDGVVSNPLTVIAS